MLTCPRCGKEKKGCGKTVFCQRCATHFDGMKRHNKNENAFFKHRYRHHTSQENSLIRNKPVTILKIWKDKE